MAPVASLQRLRTLFAFPAQRVSRCRARRPQRRKLGGTHGLCRTTDLPLPAGAGIEQAAKPRQSRPVDPPIPIDRTGKQRQFGIEPLVEPLGDEPLQHADDRRARDRKRDERGE